MNQIKVSKIPCSPFSWASIALLLAMLALSSTAAIAAPDKPDLKRIFEFSASESFQTPVIVIHGAFGARIRDTDTNDEIWPGGQADLLFGSSYDSLALDIDPVTLQPSAGNTESYALFDKVGGHDFYGKILKTLRDAGGYVEKEPGQEQTSSSHAYYLFVYDWRQDVTINAAKLDDLIEQIRRDHKKPELKVDIVAHSMGGLVTRYYMRYGRKNVLSQKTFQPDFSGGNKLRKVVLIGTPNLGSIRGLQNFLTGYKLGLGGISAETIATMPGAYQLLPNPERNWMITPSGKKADVQLYSAETWRKFGWSVFDPDAQSRIRRRFRNSNAAQQYIDTLARYFTRQLARAKRFHEALSVPVTNSPIHYIVFGGDCELTPARCLIETVRGKTVIRLHPKNIRNRVRGVNYRKLMLEPGDGSVTKPSLLARNSLDPTNTKPSNMPLAYPMFLCEEHSQLTGN
ncbi:MAG: hypothetical protein R8K54_00490, partial [Mariprofundaceae bacterium]